MLILRKFARDIPALIGLVIILSVVIIAIIGPWIAPYPGDVVASHLLRRLKPPSAAFPFGTDNLGRDLLSRVILGPAGRLKWRSPWWPPGERDRRASWSGRRLC